jgi:hypothetical protein
MAMSRVKALYFALMLVSGIAIGLVVAQRPAWQETIVPPAAWPFAISLLLELILAQAVSRGQAEPLTMGERAVGVIGAGIIVTVILAVAA